MDSVSLEAARHLISCRAITQASIQCVSGKKWIVVFQGNNDFILKSERQNPRKFGTLETAISELRKLGLPRCEIDFENWQSEPRHFRQPSLPTDQNKGSAA